MKTLVKNYNHLTLEKEDFLYKKEKSIMAHYGDFLNSFPWEWFVVFTFKYNITSDITAIKSFKDWFHTLKRRRKNQVGYFTLIQWHAVQVRLHIHSLMLGVGNSKREAWEKKWHYGNCPEIRKYEVEKKGPYYLAKMIAKGQARDYFFGGILKNTEYCKNLLVLSNKRN